MNNAAKKKPKELFLVGQPSDRPACANKVLTNRDVLSYMNYIKCESNEPWDKMISCPLMTGTKQASCKSNNGCMTEGKEFKCVVAFVKYEGAWDKTGIVMKTDQSIGRQVRGLFSDWQSMNKAKSKTSLAAEESRNKFKLKLTETFDASHPEAEEIIQKDRLRDDQQKYEDIKFLHDMRGPRTATLGINYLKYSDSVESKLLREKKERDKNDEYIKSRMSEE